MQNRAESFPYRIEIEQNGMTAENIIPFTRNQLDGIAAMNYTLSRIPSYNIPRSLRVIRRQSGRSIDLVDRFLDSNRLVATGAASSSPNTYLALATYDVNRGSLFDQLPHLGINIRNQPSRRFQAIFVGPENASIVDFGSRSFLQAAISVANWFGYDYHQFIRVVYDYGRPMEVV